MANMVVPVARYQNTGGSKYYVIQNYDTLRNFQKFIYDGTFLTNPKLLFNDVGEYLISCKVYPFSITGMFARGGKPYNISAEQISFGVGINAVDGNGNAIFGGRLTRSLWTRIDEVARYTFTERFNSFLDYEPFTKYQIYLPYSSEGFIDIDINTYMGKTLIIGLSVNFATGECMYDFKVDGNVIETHNGKCGIDLAFSQSNKNEIARNLLLTGINTTSRIMGVGANVSYKTGLRNTSKNIGEFSGIQLGQVALGSTVDIINDLHTKFAKNMESSGYLDFTKPQSIYLIKSIPNVVYPSNYNHEYGKPCAKSLYLYDCVGFTKVATCKLEGFTNATREEVKEIDILLKEGVII